MSRAMCVLTLFSGVLLTTSAVSAQAKKGDARAEEALALVKERLKELKSPETHVEAITDPVVLESLPTHRFVVVRYRQWPVAVAPPESLEAQNLFVVKDGKLQHLVDAKGLEGLFVKGEGVAKNAQQLTRSWLRLSQEFIQDGFYKFTIDEKFMEIAGSSVSLVTGTATVGPENGNKGTLRATLKFDREGKLSAIHEENKIERGMRPRCQAKLLLDADLLIRRSAEQDLLLMGRWAKGYLDEQRAAADPDLRQAIDRLWQRIVQEKH